VGGKDEICDAAQPGCAKDCSACEDGFVAAGDAAGSCIAMCEECCASLPKEVDSITSAGAAVGENNNRFFGFAVVMSLLMLLF